ncbi:ArsR/SmtB family transcription factor [Kitasatospora purpeofusca]|uniref:ArsR/SmtB family transcription factor n=1 Tax=Kitasatospora purpeofusca TaxID=67352 RepID=UPI0006892AF8|nr:helix-turn-helix domain-containing protein [Kitasatospora purpeofusca]
MTDEERLPQPAATEIDLVTVLHALGDPVRMRLLTSYADGAEHSCDPRHLGLEHLHKSTVSHHMRVLRAAGVTSTRVAGRNRYVSLRRADLDARFPGLLDALLTATGAATTTATTAATAATATATG